MIPVERFYEPTFGYRLRLKGKGNDTLLRRVVGGLAWPHGPAPGAVVALGERTHVNPEHGLREVLVLAHIEKLDPLALFQSAKTITDACLVGDWVGDITHPFIGRMDDFDDAMRQRRQRPLDLCRAPLVGESGRFAGYADLLRARVVGTKSMTFGEFQDLARAIQAITPDDEMRKQPEHYPGPCALFYALAEVDTNQPIEAKARQKRFGDPIAGY